MTASKPKVLFLCTGNSARSQMAEGYLRHVAGDQFEAMSAGIEPKGLNPLAIEAMNEIGVDISHQTSKDVVKLLGQHIPYVVTVCDNARERLSHLSPDLQVPALEFRGPRRCAGLARGKACCLPSCPR
jgi:protein-tyrosine-phosphatase